jgi:EAL domain-containing protein (putative c-di-GMP-specific phosphodiesterase class I)
VIVCPAIADATDASRVAERIMSGFKVPFAAAGRELDVAISIGVATTSSPTMDANELVRRADQALYEAKDKGRRRWQIYQEAMQRSALRRLGIQDDIRAALEAGHMRLHYQPVVDMRTGQVVGAEALVRMQHPQRGLVLPDEFIDVAEDSELIIPLGDWVLEQVCAQIAEWSQGPGFRLAMNVSSRQVMDLVSFDKVFDAAAAAGIELSCLGLEMTERVLIEGGDSVIGRLRRLTEAGVGLAIDDFGTGYSSLSYLHRFPVDTLKIDKSFIHGLVANRADTAIVEALVQLSDTLGLTVIAEGVEDEQQAAALRRIGCHLVQGYLFGRPQPPEVISGMLRARSPAAG